MIISIIMIVMILIIMIIVIILMIRSSTCMEVWRSFKASIVKDWIQLTWRGIGTVFGEDHGNGRWRNTCRNRGRSITRGWCEEKCSLELMSNARMWGSGVYRKFLNHLFLHLTCRWRTAASGTTKSCEQIILWSEYDARNLDLELSAWDIPEDTSRLDQPDRRTIVPEAHSRRERVA